MPIYEYKCPKCKTKFELMRSFSQSNEAAVCENCKGCAPRVVSRFASFSIGEGGVSSPVGGGGGCGGCSSTTGCDTCAG